MSPVRRFFLTFAVLGAVAGAVAVISGRAIIGFDCCLTAAGVGRVLAALGHENRVEGSDIFLGEQELRVGIACTALGYAAIFLCALAAWPAPWKRRIAAVAVSVVLLFAMDLTRVTALVLLMQSRFFESVHALSGAAYVAILLFLWLLWVRLSGTPVPIRPAHPAIVGAVALAFVFSLGELALAQGPPPPPPPPAPLGGAPFALTGVVVSSWFLLRRSG